jgi:hypothetical protein
MTRGRKPPWGSPVPWGSNAPGKKKPRYNRGESVTGANDAPGWGYRARSPAQGGERERSRRTCVIRHPAPREVPQFRRQVTPDGTGDHLFNGGRKRVPGRARRALCNKFHKEQYVTNCIISIPRVGYFLTGVTVPQAASGFWGVCPHLIHRDIHRICGRPGSPRNNGSLSRRVESLRKLFLQAMLPFAFLFPHCRNGGHDRYFTRFARDDFFQELSEDQRGPGPVAAAPLPSPVSR